MEIKPWDKVGPLETLSESHNKVFVVQKFINPISRRIEEFSFFFGRVDSVIIFPITKDKEIIAIRQFRHAADDVFIELPGGNIGRGESYYDAANRELFEESGYKSANLRFLNTKKAWFDPGVMKNFYIPCLATDCYYVSKPMLDNTECIEPVAIPIREWLDMIHNGLINDSKTLAVTLLALPYLGIDFK